MIWQVLDHNFSWTNFLRTQDPIGQCVRASNQPYSALQRLRAGLSSWAVDFGLVGLKKFIRFFQASCWRLEQKKHWVHQCFFDLVGRSGIEPLASTVWRWHSTAELTTQILYCLLLWRTKLFTLLLQWLNYHRHIQNYLLMRTQNLRKDIEKSMTSSIEGLYYFFLLKSL